MTIPTYDKLCFAWQNRVLLPCMFGTDAYVALLAQGHIVPEEKLYREADVTLTNGVGTFSTGEGLTASWDSGKFLYFNGSAWYAEYPYWNIIGAVSAWTEDTTLPWPNATKDYDIVIIHPDYKGVFQGGSVVSHAIGTR